ncbi:beta-ketoacyl-[acyl-carrier-protein] synthase family protein [Candidatus Woesearchaeota archaeon]|nr:beta-ketoacyl-[acyl-carrier-protein] synthase family protein [Candidatus Woesearchaeota archaeon]
MNSVVITGLGPISPNVEGTQDIIKFWNSTIYGNSGIRDLEELMWIKSDKFDSFPVKKAGKIIGFDGNEYGMSAKDARKADKCIQFALASSYLALKDAKVLDDSGKSKIADISVQMGIGLGGMETIETEIPRMVRGFDSGKSTYTRVNPTYVPTVMANAAAAKVTKNFGLLGEPITMSSACASSMTAIGNAYRSVKHGYYDIVLAGGTEAPLVPSALASFAMAGALSRSGISRPFDKERDGFVPGEGSGMLVLESRKHAEERGAMIYAEIVGYGAVADRTPDMTSPDEDGYGLQQTILKALKEAGIRPDKIDHINAHGTSTELNDLTESAVFNLIFGEYVKQIPVTALKSMTGHAMGGIGGLETIETAFALHSGAVPPTINFQSPGDGINLRIVTESYCPERMRYALKTAAGFGGQNAALILKRYEK